MRSRWLLCDCGRMLVDNGVVAFEMVLLQIGDRKVSVQRCIQEEADFRGGRSRNGCEFWAQV